MRAPFVPTQLSCCVSVEDLLESEHTELDADADAGPDLMDVEPDKSDMEQDLRIV